MNFWQGEKVRLRGVEPADWEYFFKWNLDSERARHLDFLWPPISKQQVVDWCLEQSRKKLENDTFHWVIENKPGQPVGSISTHDCNQRNGTFGYGVDVAAEHRRKGFAAEAIKLVLKYYFEELRYQKVTTPVHSNNQPSIQLHEKLGFKKEGTLRRMVYTEGKYYDTIWFGMTREEFSNMQS